MSDPYRRWHPLLDPAGDGGVPPPSRRASSVQLRDSGDSGHDPLDPANRSLADALNVMYMLLKVGMAALGVAFLLTGFQRVNEGEQGIRLLFGEVQATNLEPGLRWSAPYPIGELRRISKQGLDGVSIDKEFWVFIQEGTTDPSPDKLAPTQSLKPDQGNAGYVLTSDGNIAHVKWRVSYKRDDIAKYAATILESQEKEIVRAAVKRGAVHACAQMKIEDLLKQGSATSSVALLAKGVAQETLDRMGSGLVIDQCILDQVIAPLWVRKDFEKVAATVSEAAKAREKAQTDRSTRLNEVGGEAAAYLVGESTDTRRIVGLITQYETAIAAEDAAAQARVLDQIEGVMEGRRVEVEVEVRTPSGEWAKQKQVVENLAAGEIVSRLQDARRYRSEVVNSARSDLLRFEAKLAQFKANPLLMVQREWSLALRDFMSKDSVQLMIIPPGTRTATIQLNSDPDILKEMQQLQRQRENEIVNQKRLEELRRGEYKTNTDLQEVPS